jgi:hypothetical protein
MFSFFRKKEKPDQNTNDFASLVNRRAQDFRSFYTERVGDKLDFQFQSLHIVDTIIISARTGAASNYRKQWLAAHAGAYLYRTAASRVSGYKYIWYHPLDQLMMVVGPPQYRIALLAQEAVQQRLDTAQAFTLTQLYASFERALVNAKPGDDLLLL